MAGVEIRHLEHGTGCGQQFLLDQIGEFRVAGDAMHHVQDDREALRAMISIVFNIVRPVILYKRCAKHAVRRVDSEKHVSPDHGLVNVARPAVVVQDFMPPKVGGIGDVVRFPAVGYRLSGDINAAREKCIVLKSRRLSLLWDSGKHNTE